jgi:hypothetical protein
MLRLAGNQNQKWGRGTWVCVVNLDLGTFGPPLGVAGGGRSDLSFYVGSKGW